MIPQRITVKPSRHSAVTALLAKFKRAGIEPIGRKYTFKIDDPNREAKSSGRVVSDIGAGIRPIQQPSKRKPGRKAGTSNKQNSKLASRRTHPFVCKQCAKPGMSVTGRREFCDDGGLCKGRWLTAQRKAGQ